MSGHCPRCHTLIPETTTICACGFALLEGRSGIGETGREVARIAIIDQN